MLPVIPSNKPKNQGAPPRRGPQTSAVVRTTLYFLCELSGVGGRTPALAAGPPPAERTILKNEKKIYLPFSSKMILFTGESN
jgi:hypothetical protein